MRGTGLRAMTVVAGAALVAALHALAPAGPHAWHWVHLVAAQLYFVPILLAAAWLGVRATVGVTLAVSALSVAHIARNWAGLPMVQAEQLAQITTYWLVALVSATLLRREREARETLRRAHEETLAALAGSLELRERATAGHSLRVRDYALLVAGEMGFHDPVFLASLAQGALLHDVGKIGIPDRILLKPAPLDPWELTVMRRHPEMGASLVGEIASLGAARELILAHHERYDGKGYPRGLAGAAIPLAARVFAACDALDALTADRPYRNALTWEAAVSEIAGGRGSQFDPEVTDAVLRIPFDEWSRVAVGTGVTLRRAPPNESASAGPYPGGLEHERGTAVAVPGRKTSGTAFD